MLASVKCLRTDRRLSLTDFRQGTPLRHEASLGLYEAALWLHEASLWLHKKNCMDVSNNSIDLIHTEHVACTHSRLQEAAGFGMLHVSARLVELVV